MKPYDILVPGKYLMKVEVILCNVCSQELLLSIVLFQGEQVLCGTNICSQKHTNMYIKHFENDYA